MPHAGHAKDGADIQGGGSDSAHQPEAVAASLDEPGSKIWQPYLDQAEKYDEELVESWRDDMDALLIFAALFSSSVTAFVVESYQLLQQSPTDTTNNLLYQISQQLSNSTIPPATPVSSSFSPSKSNVTINICWFLSLSFSLACSLAAVMVRQWARHYLRVPRSLSSTPERARMRQFLFENVVTWKLEFAVEMIPALLHISVILFMIGLILFLQVVNHQVAVCLLLFGFIALAAYTMLTLMPILFPGCPYRTPFSRSAVPIFLIIWKGLIAAAALLTFITACTASGLSFAVRKIPWLCLPSHTCQLSTWANDTLSQTTPILRRIFTNAPVTQVHHHPLALSPDDNKEHTSIVSLINYALSIPTRFSVERRRRLLANTETHVRDSNALNWAIGFSSRGENLVAVVDAIPDYFKSLTRERSMMSADGEMSRRVYRTQAVLLQTDIVLRINRLLGACVEGVEPKDSMRSITISCMEAIYWLARCPDRSQTAVDADSMPRSPPFQIHAANSTWRILGKGEEYMAVLVQCTLSSLLMNQIYRAEVAIQNSKVKAWPDKYMEARALLRLARSTAGRLKDLVDMDSADITELAVSWLLPEKSPSEFDAGDAQKALIGFQAFRERLALMMLNVFGRHPALKSKLHSPDSVIFNCLCDAATHLRHFPHSTTTTQLAIFRFLDDMARASSSVDSIPTSLLSVYTNVLCGPCTYIPWSVTRDQIHSCFFQSMRVHQVQAPGDAPGFAGSRVTVTFEDYDAVLRELARALGTAGSAEDKSTHDDAHAQAIYALIQRRIRDPTVASIPVPPGHANVVQELLSTSRSVGLHDCIWCIARTFGYAADLKNSGVEWVNNMLNVESAAVDGHHESWRQSAIPVIVPPFVLQQHNYPE